MFAWTLALQYLRRRWVNVLGTVGVMVAVWSLIVVRGVFSGFIEDIRSDVRRSSPDLLITTLPQETSFDRLQEALAGEPDIEALAPRLRHYGIFFQRTSAAFTQSMELEFSSIDSNFVQLVGVDPELERTVTDFDGWLERGRSLLFTNQQARPPELGPELQVPAELEWEARTRLGLPAPATAAEHRALWPGLLLGRERANYLRRHRIGDPLDLLSVDYLPNPQGGARAVTLQRTFAFAGAYQTGARLFDETMAIVPIEPLRSMLGHDALDSDSVDLCSDVAVRAAPGLSLDQLEALAGRLLPKVRAALGPQGQQAEILTWEQQNAVFLDAVDTERAMTTLVLFAVMLIAAFLIYATLHMMVTQKTKDIGILLALGGSPRGIGQIFTRCGFVIGGIGALGGLALGLLSLHNLNALNDWLYTTVGFELFPRNLFALPKVPYRIEPEWMAGVAIAAFLLTLFVAWIPAKKAARLPPVKALSYE